MTISAIDATPSATSARSLTLEDFLKVLLTQLTFQDPLKPMDNQEFMAQVAQFTTLEQTQQLNTSMRALLNNQSSLQTVGLIGRTVDVVTEGGTFSGTVSALSLAGTQPLLSIRLANGTVATDISLSEITSVR